MASPPTVETLATGRLSVGPGDTLLPAEFDKASGEIIPYPPNSTNNSSMSGIVGDDLSNQDVGTSASTIVVTEDFETGFSDGGLWSRTASPTWGDVPCFPAEPGFVSGSAGTGSAWAADDFTDPADCNAVTYQNNMASWLIYGPFSLADAQLAYLEFSFRIISESCVPITNCDYLFYGASIDGSNFFGNRVAGTYTSGPFANGHNFASLNLSDVPTLGNLLGQPQVWDWVSSLKVMGVLLIKVLLSILLPCEKIRILLLT